MLALVLLFVLMASRVVGVLSLVFLSLLLAWIVSKSSFSDGLKFKRFPEESTFTFFFVLWLIGKLTSTDVKDFSASFLSI